MTKEEARIAREQATSGFSLFRISSFGFSWVMGYFVIRPLACPQNGM
jgi:hypothetical protein